MLPMLKAETIINTIDKRKTDKSIMSDPPKRDLRSGDIGLVKK